MNSLKPKRKKLYFTMENERQNFESIQGVGS